MHVAILPDADRGMPRWGVAPSHGFNGRIGIADPATVAQPQTRQRHAESASCTSGARFPCTGTPTWDVHSWIGIGNVENGLRFLVLRIDIGKLRDGGRTRPRRVDLQRDPTPRTSRLAEPASLRELSFAQIVQSVNRTGIPDLRSCCGRVTYGIRRSDSRCSVPADWIGRRPLRGRPSRAVLSCPSSVC